MRIQAAIRTIRGFAACERGNVLIELGLVATLLTATVMGMAEYAAVSSQSSKLSNAARAAVERAMKDPADITGITDVAVKSGNLTAATLTVAVNQFCECADTGTAACTDTCADGDLSNMFITVSLSQPAESFLQGSSVMPNFTLDRAATMRVR